MLTEIFSVSSEEAIHRLDTLLKTHFPDTSRAYIQSLINQEMVLVNGKHQKKRFQCKPGDEIKVTFIPVPKMDLTPEAIPLEILFEDEHIIAINKPAGMVVHPAPGHLSGTFVHALLHHCDEIESEEDSLRPGIVHRLDKDTSGVLIAAKTRAAHQRLIEAFSSRALKKTYLAICGGNPKDQTVDLPIGRHPIRREERVVLQEGGKPATSIVRSLEHTGKLALAEVELCTGRTHQIRVHMKAIGCPILGDSLYGAPHLNKNHGVSRQMLHAHTLTLTHPIKGEPIVITAPLPEDFRKLVKNHFSETISKKFL